MLVVLASSSGIAAVAGLILAAASVAQLADLMVLADLIRLSQRLGDLCSLKVCLVGIGQGTRWP